MASENPKPPIATATATDPPIATAPPPSPSTPIPYRILGSGGFGAVISPAFPNTKMNPNGSTTDEYYPENVMKMYFHEGQFNSALRAYEKIPELVGHNDGHRVSTYRKKYTLKNIPNSIIKTLNKKIPNLDPDKEIHLMRIPYLGIDLNGIEGTFVTDIQKIPFHTILKQIQKLFHQIASITAADYGHFDVRQQNIMINPKTGIMTLIDFDYLKPLSVLKDRFPFGFYINPPEALFIKKFRSDPSYVISHKLTLDQIKQWFFEIKRDGDKIRTYAFYNVKFLPHFLLNHEIPVTQTNLIAEIVNANVENFRALQKVADPGTLFYEKSLKTFDSYSLAAALLQTISILYPFTLTSIKKTKENIRSLIPFKTEDELEIIAITVCDLARLFIRMTNFQFESRLGIVPAKTIMDNLVRDFETDLGIVSSIGAAVGGAGTASSVALVAAPLPTSSAVGGAGTASTPSVAGMAGGYHKNKKKHRMTRFSYTRKTKRKYK